MDYLDAFLSLIACCLLGQTALGRRGSAGRLIARFEMLPMLVPVPAVGSRGGRADWDREAPPLVRRLRPVAARAGGGLPAHRRFPPLI
jgi:hypothetical protein